MDTAVVDLADLPASTGDYTKDRVVELLGAGVTPVQVASAVGCSESYVSQLLAVPEIEAMVRKLRSERAAEYIEHDDSVQAAEKAALGLVRRNVDNGFLKPMEALKHFQVLNAARRKSDSTGGTAVPTNTIVNFTLPENAAVQFKMTTDRQVIEVDGRSMATLPAAQVAKMLREKKAAEQLLESLEPLRIEIGEAAAAMISELDKI